MKGAGLPAARAAGGNEGGGKVGGRRGAETAAVVTAAGSEGRRGASGVCTIVWHMQCVRNRRGFGFLNLIQNSLILSGVIHEQVDFLAVRISTRNETTHH